MPRLVNRLPKYSEHKATGQARVRINGKTVYLGKMNSPESMAKYQVLVSQLSTPDNTAPAEPVPGQVLLVGEALLLFVRHAEGYYVHMDGTPTTEVEAIKAALKPVRKMFGDRPVTEFGPKKLKQLQKTLAEEKATRFYINRQCAIIKRAFMWLASEELVPAGIAVALKTVAGLKKGRTSARELPPVRPVPDDVLEATLPHMPELAADACRVMRWTGARPGEICRMTADAIDRSDPSCWKYVPAHHKTAHHDKSRMIPIGPKAQEIVRRHIVKAGADGRLFPIGVATLWSAIERGCKKAFPHPVLSAIPDEQLTDAQRAQLKTWVLSHRWHPNQIRHTRLTEVRAQDGLEAAQVLGGHSKADVTQVYAERDTAKALEVARKSG